VLLLFGVKKSITGRWRWCKLYNTLLFCENWAWVHQYADPGRAKSWWGPDPRTSPGLTPLVNVSGAFGIRTYTVSQKSSTSYFAKYFRAGLTDCKNFNGYRVGDNKRTQGCNQCFNF